MLIWSINRNPNRNLNKLIGIPIGTQAINVSHNHSTDKVDEHKVDGTRSKYGHYDSVNKDREKFDRDVRYYISG